MVCRSGNIRGASRSVQLGRPSLLLVKSIDFAKQDDKFLSISPDVLLPAIASDCQDIKLPKKRGWLIKALSKFSSSRKALSSPQRARKWRSKIKIAVTSKTLSVFSSSEVIWLGTSSSPSTIFHIYNISVQHLHHEFPLQLFFFCKVGCCVPPIPLTFGQK